MCRQKNTKVYATQITAKAKFKFKKLAKQIKVPEIIEAWFENMTKHRETPKTVKNKNIDQTSTKSGQEIDQT